tara:strand:+ start:74 stop:769 length:696 start_codon:yes stop_codon:yes gene_type:complete
MKAIPIRTFLTFLLMTPFITESALAVSRTDFFQGSLNYKPSKHIIHTVQENESLWKIASEFGVDFRQLASINGLNNPDMIFPGTKLIIKIQDDGSVWVMKNILPLNYTPAKTIVHVSLPNKDDPFAPENPTVSYEVKAPVLKPAEQTVKETLVFKTFEKFVRWLSSSLGYSSDLIQTRGQASFDPPTSPTYLHSETLHIDTSSEKESELAVFIDNFSSHITRPTSPPPKSL